MTEYKIVKSSEYITMELRVNELLRDGWKLRGELIINYVHAGTNGTLYYHQVMIK